MIPVTEIFLAVQGEGPVAGRPSVFVRVGGCDSDCSWCDSEFAASARHKADWSLMEPDQIVAKVRTLADPPFLVTLSGGNPCLYEELSEVVHELQELGHVVACETQGTRWVSWLDDVDVLVVSPKPPSSGCSLPKDAFLWFMEKVLLKRASTYFAVKIPVLNEADLEYAGTLRNPAGHPLYLQPVTFEIDKIQVILNKTRWLNEEVLRRKWYDACVIPALQSLLYGRERQR